jgi:hypothetical protein
LEADIEPMLMDGTGCWDAARPGDEEQRTPLYKKSIIKSIQYAIQITNSLAYTLKICRP